MGHTGPQSALRALQAFLVAALFCCSLACKTPPNDEIRYQQIAKQIENADFDLAREASKQEWQRHPDSYAGWRFKAQYLLMLLYRNKEGDVTEVARVLSQKLPPAYSHLEARYDYLKALLAVTEKERPKILQFSESALNLATAQADHEVENDALILLANQDPDRQARLKLLNRAIKNARNHGLAYQEASILLNLGLEMKNMEQYSVAISDYFLPAAQIANTLQSRLLQAGILNDLGLCYMNLGDLDQAMISFTQARAKLVASDPPIVISDVNMELGRISLLQLDNADAIRYFRQSFAAIENKPKSEQFAPAIFKLAAGLIEVGQLDEAEKLNERGGKVLVGHHEPYQNAWYNLNRADIADRLGHSKEARSLYTKVLQTPRLDLADLEWPAYARLADLESRESHRLEAGKNFERALRAIEASRSKQKATEHQLTFLSALIRFYQQYVEFLMKQNRPWDALAVADSSRASVLTRGSESSRDIPDFVAKVRLEARNSNRALLFYWLAPTRSFLWLMTPNSAVFKELPGERTITEDVNAYSSNIQAAVEDPLKSQNAAGLRLYQTLIAPISSSIDEGMRVVVIPDGALHGLNFETLLVRGAKPHYWLDDVTLTVAPSLRILIDKQESAQSSGRALIIGDGIYSGDPYQPLPQSKVEVANLRALFPKEKTTVLAQADAVPEAYKKAHPENFSFIHFSAHVETNEKSPLDSAIILSPGLYGSRQLYARELMQAKHLNADLVTISGCNSAGKKPLAGEGMVGFAWAALNAGARNALTSLWEVDDDSTTELMTSFYSEVRQRRSTYADALHSAKLQLRGKYNKPYFWASFQLYSRNLGQDTAQMLQANR